MTLTLSERVAAFVQLGKQINSESYFFNHSIKPILGSVYNSNGWFTEQSVTKSLNSISEMLKEENLIEWLSAYHMSDDNSTKNIGIIMASNIPMVGFHDLLCVLISGNAAIVKTSKDDSILPKIICDKLIESEPRFKYLIKIVEGKLEDFDAVIATGSNNTARYFESYFGKYPNIIRKNRNSIAVLSGNELSIDLQNLGHDIFDYFGLGCRNVNKLYVPIGYEFSNFFESIFSFGYVANINKYANNYDYNRAVYLMNSLPFLDNNFLIIRESQDFSSPVAVLNYQYYSEIQEVINDIEVHKNNIQCIVSSHEAIVSSIDFGKSQTPMLWDYADNIDTIKFLIELNN